MRFFTLIIFFLLNTLNVFAQSFNNGDSISKTPLMTHLYNTWWAYMICIVLLILAIVGLLKWNKRQSEKAKQQLEKIIEEQKKELLLQSENFKQQHEEIITQSEHLKNATLEIQTAYKDIQTLSEIGQKITSSLDINAILEIVYANVNELMTAEVFGIGLYNEQKQEIEYKLAIEKGQRYKPYSRDMTDKNQFPIWCIENKQDVFINSVFEEYGKYLTSYEDESSELEDGTLSEVVQSIMYLPLLIGGKVIGIITVQSYKKGAYTTQHLTMLKTLASYISIAIENSKTYLLISEQNDQITVQNEELYQQHEEIITQSEHLKNATLEIQTAYKDIQTLSEIGQKITSSLDINAILEIVYANVNELMTAEVFGIGLYNEQKQEIEYKLAIEKGQRYKPYSRDMTDKNQFPIWCIENKQDVFINSVFEEYGKYLTSYEDESSELEDGTLSEVVQSIMYLPLLIGGKVIGIITVQSYKKYAYTQQHLTMLKTLASYISIAIENSKTYLLVSEQNDQITVQNEELYQQQEEIITQSENLKNASLEIQTAYKDIQTLSEIGQKITSSLDINAILEIVYANVNELMTAEVFGIGLYNEQKQEIEYKLAIEKGQRYKPYSRDMTDKNQFPIWCIENKQDVFINSVFEEYGKYLTSYEDESSELEDGTLSEVVQSIMYLPLLIGGKVIGIITVQSYKKYAYTQQHLTMLKTLASYISIAIENSKTYLLVSEQNDQITVQNEELFQQHEEIITQSEHLKNATLEIQTAYKDIQTLSEIGQKITSSLDINAILEIVYANVNELMTAEVFGIGLYNEQKQEIEYKLAIEKGQRYKPYSRDMTDKNQFPIWCIENKQDVFINSVFEEYGKYLTSYEDESSELEDGTLSEVVQSIMYLPLLIGGKVIGIITVQSYKKYAYTQQHLTMLKTLASYISIAIENSKTYLLVSEQNDQITVQNEELFQQHEEIITQSEHLKNATLEIQTAYKDIQTLSEIGQKITSSLDINAILEIVYANVNELMTAEVFGIGLYNEQKQEIEYKLAIEKGQRYKPYSRDMTDKNQFPIWCIENKQDVFINSVFEEYGKYLTSYEDESSELEDGTLSEVVQSIMYLPLLIGGKVIGIITVQSYKKYAYTQQHLTMLKTLASYISIAIENSKTYLLVSEQNDQITVQNEELYQQQEEIITQRDFISQTNDELAYQYSQVRQSVEAAKLIQDAILPQENKVKKFLPNYFVLYRPKDVVSGDFFWIEQIEDKIFIAVVDCTGHGVPGAFMSMIANMLLENIIKVQKIFSPNEVLQVLNDEIQYTLRQKEVDDDHGMDIGLICITKSVEHFTISFAGAKRHLHFISSTTQEMKVIKGNKFSIGGKHSFDKLFTKQVIELPYDSTLYLFTDGYSDQCNNDRISFSSLKLKQLLSEISVLALETQKEVLETTLDNFKENSDQRDDILLVGVKVER